MNLKFTYGKAYSNLKEECIKAIQNDIQDVNINKILVITNESYKKEIEIGIRSANIVDPELKIQVSTIKELCANAINNFGDRRIRQLNEDEEFALLVHSITKVKNKLRLYKNLVLNKTFIKSIKATISNFKKEQITPKILEAKCDSLNNQLTKDKLTDFNTIFREYTNNLANKYLDTEDKINYAIKLLQENRNEYNCNVYLYKLDNASKQELEVIKTLTNKNSNVRAFIINDNFNREPSNLSGAFFKTDSFVLKLKKLWDEDINIDNKYIENNIISKELGHLESNLFNYPYSELKEQPKDIFLTECSSIENEVETLVLNIEELRDNGTDLNSITIAASNISQYERLLRTLFDKCDIPYSISVSIDLAFHPLARFIEILLDLYTEKDKGTFLRLLKTGYIALTLENIGIIEKYINSNGFTFIDEIDIEELIRLKFSQEEELKLLLENLKIAFLAYDTVNTFTDFYKTTFDFIESINITNLLKERISEEFAIDNESITLQTWQSIIKQLDSYSSILNNTEIDKDTFIFLVSSILSNLKCNLNIDRAGVRIIPINNIEEGLGTVFILGANEGVLPAKPKTTTIFTERDILELNSIGLLLGEDTISIVLSEQFNTYKLLTSAERKIFISYSTVGKDLAVMKKSSITSRIKQLFPMVKDSRTLCNNKEFNSTLSTKSNLNNFNLIKNIINEIHLLDEEDKKDFISKLESLKEIELYDTYVESLVSALKYNNKANCDDKHTLQSLYYSDTLSVSKLEKYAKCPFAYFAEYGLKVKEDEPTTLQAKHIGIAIHGIIEQFDIRLKKNNKSWNNIDNEYITSEINLIMNYLEKRSSLDIFNSSESAKYYKNKLKELSKTSIVALTKHIGNSFFECLGHEINFDDRGTYPPITIKLPSGKRLKLRGQIDRLDEMKTNNGKFIRIVDYKTGNTTLDLTEVCYGTQLQLLTYLDAIIGSGEENEYLPAGAFYFKVDDPYIKVTPNASDDYILENKLKELRMKGLFTNNGDVVQCMDKGIYDGEYKTSLNIQAKFKTDGKLSKSTPGISMSDLETLRKYTKEIIKESAYKMLVEGDISIKPTRKKSIEACTYCQYKCICQFDETLEFNNFKQLIELSKDEVINIASKKVGGSDE